MNPARQELAAVDNRQDDKPAPDAQAFQVIDKRPSHAVPVAANIEQPTPAGADATPPPPGLMLPRGRIDAFTASPSLLATLEAAAKDRRSVRSEFTIRPGGFAEAMDVYRGSPPPDLVVIEDSSAVEDLEWKIEALAEFCPPTTRLLVVGDCNDILLYRRLIKLGVSDYLVQPITPLTLLDSIAAIVIDEDDSKDLGLVVAFVGVRGGVGASTVAHNAASICARRFDATTLLIDADIGFGTAALQFDIAAPQGLADALKEGEDLDSEVLERLTHWRDKRFGILAAPDRPDQMAFPEPGVMRHLVDQARRLAKFVILDLPHGWSPHTAEAIAAADRVVLVATPDLPSLRNARTLLGLLQKLRPNDEPPQLVLNRMPTRGKPCVSKEDFVRVLDRKVAVALPCDEAAVSAEMAGCVLAEDAPSCDFVNGIGTLITEVSGREPFTSVKAIPASLFSRLFSRSR